MESTSIGCNQWLSLAKITLKVPLDGRNRSLVANTSNCGEGIRPKVFPKNRVKLPWLQQRHPAIPMHLQKLAPEIFQVGFSEVAFTRAHCFIYRAMNVG
jgi:hypothetical protein